MAQKHRFKKNREFKKRLDEQESNEEGDIRSFSFHRHDIDFGDKRGESKGRFDNKRGRNDDRKEGRGFKGNRDFKRSEEHTSELQSRQYLVCRLLLEKKKNKNKNYMAAIHYARE